MRVLLAALLACAACRSLPPSKATKEADARWDRQRSRIALKSAAQRLSLNDAEGARRELESALLMGAQDPRIHLLLARIALEQGEFEECETQLVRLRAEEPESVEADFLQGMLEEVAGDWDAATEAYAAAARKRPRDPAPVLAQIRTLHGAGRPEEARAFAERALEAMPESKELVRAAADELLAAGEPGRALALLERLLAAEPGDGDALRGRALALHGAGRHEDAVRELRALELDAATGLALGQSALITGDYEASVRGFRRYLADDPAEPAALFDLARALFLAGRGADAHREVGRALSIAPDFTEAAVLQGHLHFHARRWSAAATSYRRALDLGADAATVQPLLETATARQGEGG